MIVTGLIALLVVPALAFHRAELYRRHIDNDVDPARQQIRAAIGAANDARSAAFYYVFTLDDAYARRFHDLRREWDRLNADDKHISQCGASVVTDWQAGRHVMDRWFGLYGERYVKFGEQVELAQSDRLFGQGEEFLRRAGVAADAASAVARDEAALASRAEVAVLAILAGVCVMIATLAWQGERNRTLLWRRERDMAARLQLAVTETNHRVKNNLQVVASLIETIRMEHDDRVPSEELRDVVRQVRAIAAVHDFLSRDLKSDIVAADGMLKRLVDLTAKPAGLAARVDATAAPLDVKQATAVALITNELLLNAGKHGASKVAIKMETDGADSHLVVKDNGPGFPEGFDPQTEGNIGLALVRTLARHDLRGAVSFANNGGAVVEVTFPARPSES